MPQKRSRYAHTNGRVVPTGEKWSRDASWSANVDACAALPRDRSSATSAFASYKREWQTRSNESTTDTSTCATSVPATPASCVLMQGWPRASTTKRLASYANRLKQHGAISWEEVSGKSWNDSVLEELGGVESESWIPSRTDGNGAKFLKPAQRALWREVLTDPVLAAALSATILRIDGQAVGFTFDLDDGATRHGIAGSYNRAFRTCNVGKLVNYRKLEDTIARGFSSLNMGVGDTGYKREMGAVAGDRLIDVLFVRDRLLASALRWWWCRQGAGRISVAEMQNHQRQPPLT